MIALAKLCFKTGNELQALGQIIQIFFTPLGKPQGFRRIQVKIGLRHNPWDVRTINTNRKKDRSFVRIDGFDGRAGGFVVAHFRDRYIRNIPNGGGV